MLWATAKNEKESFTLRLFTKKKETKFKTKNNYVM